MKDRRVFSDFKPQFSTLLSKSYTALSFPPFQHLLSLKIALTNGLWEDLERAWREGRPVREICRRSICAAEEETGSISDWQEMWDS